MQVKEVMTPSPQIVDPETTIQKAAHMMQELDTGFIPVGENDRLVGTVTDRDITVRAVAEGKDPSHTFIRDVMSPGVVYCFEDEDVTEAAHKMENEQIRRILVLNRDKRLTGVVSLGDIAGCNHDLSGEVLEAVSCQSA